MPPDRDLIAYLDFHVEAGVDGVLDEHPHDRFVEADAPAHQAAAPPLQAPPLQAPRPETWKPPAASPRSYGRSVTAAPDEVTDDAREQARSAATLEELEALLQRFDGCTLKASAKTLVFGGGDPASRVMLVGEMPGADEDRVGKPFMGRSGHLLDRMLAAIDLTRDGVYVANIVPWRPPGNRNPTPQEIAICKPFVERQIELADPDILVCLGGPATQNLTGTRDGILKSRGRWFPYKTGRREIRALATLHPAYLLRQPLQKRLVWRDFRALKAALDAPR